MICFRVTDGWVPGVGTRVCYWRDGPGVARWSRYDNESGDFGESPADQAFGPS
jgi:hypothetical protein